ncbi:AMP-binding protein [Rheinheimera marina]|uniref:AMP-binding protein n=1 Tax=Rheinheimera marina TaxID=1774958 RepID=A0ABV9JRL6_9GAMM
MSYPHLAGQAVVLPYVNLQDFICHLLALDGYCTAVYLQPESALPLPEPALPLTRATVATPDSVHQDTQWFIATSGTTGTPKWIGHRMASLTQAVKSSDANTQLCWALCYQPFRFAGLQVVLQSLLSGASLSDCSSGDAYLKLDNMQKYAVSAVSATPSMWRQLLLTGKLDALRLSHLTLGGEIADQQLLDRLSTLFPTARIMHIYASTEAGVGFAVTDRRAGFPAQWLQSGIHGIEFRLDETSHLWLKPRYRPVNLPPARLNDEGFIDSEDLAVLQGDRVLFLGRAGGIINVGGNKVHPEQVEQLLLQVPGVAQVHVYGKASSLLGQLVVADLVAETGAETTALQKQLLSHCLKHLQRYQIPTRFNWVECLTTGLSGKLNRSAKHNV